MEQEDNTLVFVGQYTNYSVLPHWPYGSIEGEGIHCYRWKDAKLELLSVTRELNPAVLKWVPVPAAYLAPAAAIGAQSGDRVAAACGGGGGLNAWRPRLVRPADKARRRPDSRAFGRMLPLPRRAACARRNSRSAGSAACWRGLSPAGSAHARSCAAWAAARAA